MKLNTVSAVTKSCLKDFLLMRETLQQHHFAEFHVAVDEYCYEYLHENFLNVKCFKLIKTEGADHVSPDKQQRKDFIDIIKAKFEVAKEVLKENNFIFWCDIDHIFFNPLDEKILESVNQKRIDAALTPHHSDGFADEKTVGYYNCGFVLISNPDFLNTWSDLFDKHEELGVYFEQKPLELTTQFYSTITLPINYNLGWWKFLGPNGQKRWDSVRLAQNSLTIFDLPLINFHFHFFKDNNHSFDQGAFKNAVSDVFQRRGAKGDNLISYFIERLQNENI
jgi:hypothetical protein